jgi:hypothetical protein
MVDRNTMFGTPSYRWLPAKSRLTADYWAIVEACEVIPESLDRP